jgi:photosystem II stability/assembly factor-like uncharacterized protein
MIIRFQLIFCCAILLISRPAFAQEYQTWKWLHQQPQGNTLRWLKMWNASTWYAVGAAGTFLKTTDSGASWYFHHRAGVPSTSGGTNPLNAAYFFDMNRGVAGGTGGITRTTNGGVSWDTSSGLPSAAFWSNFFFIDSAGGFAAGSTSGRFAKTTDAGATWTAFPNLPTLPAATYNDVFALSENKLFIVGTPAGGANFRRSTDGGATWLASAAGSGALNAVHFIDSLSGFVVGSGGYAAKTSDRGVTWIPLSTGVPSTTALQDIYSRLIQPVPEIYLTGDQFNLYKTTNLGTTWTAVSFLPSGGQQPWTSTYYNTQAVGNTFVTVGAFGLINTSTNNGTTWSTLTTFIKSGTLNDVWAENGHGKIWAVGAPGVAGQSYDQIMYSSNGGMSWSIQSTVNSIATFNSISMVNTTTGYVAGTSGRVRKTTNGGASWDSVPTPITVTLNKVEFIDMNIGWVFGASGNIWKTTNGGAQWTQQTATGVTGTISDADMIDAANGWLVGASGAISRTTDGGTTWTPQQASLGTSTINGIKMLNATTGYLVSTSGRVRRTTNGGTSWDSVVTPVTSTLNQVDLADVNNVMVTGTTGTMLRSSNGGTSWILENTGGSTMNGIRMVHRDTAFSVGLQAAVFKYAVTGTAGVTYTPEIPMRYELSQNFPNPFNPSTTVRFTLPKAGTVSLRVHDITGRQIARPINDMPLNAGTFTYRFDAFNLASGVYFYSLSVDHVLRDAKKMLLLR